MKAVERRQVAFARHAIGALDALLDQAFDQKMAGDGRGACVCHAVIVPREVKLPRSNDTPRNHKMSFLSRQIAHELRLTDTVPDRLKA